MNEKKKLRISPYFPSRTFDVNNLRDIFDFEINAKEDQYGINLSLALEKSSHFSGILELPREVNKLIMEFLKIKIQFNLLVHPPRSYPFLPFKWKLGNYSPNDVDVYKCLSSVIDVEHSSPLYDSGQWTPAWSLESMCLVFFIKIEKFFKETRFA